jgi:hypothetical protein
MVRTQYVEREDRELGDDARRLLLPLSPDLRTTVTATRVEEGMPMLYYWYYLHVAQGRYVEERDEVLRLCTGRPFDSQTPSIHTYVLVV